MTLEERMKQIQYCLIRAKVDLEYGIRHGTLNGTNFFDTAHKEIEKAIEYAFMKEDE